MLLSPGVYKYIVSMTMLGIEKRRAVHGCLEVGEIVNGALPVDANTRQIALDCYLPLTKR